MKELCSNNAQPGPEERNIVRDGRERHTRQEKNHSVSSEDAGATCQRTALRTRCGSSTKRAASSSEESSVHHPTVASSPIGYVTFFSAIPQTYSAAMGRQ